MELLLLLLLSIGRVLPVHFHTPFVHSNVRKSFTIPQGRTKNRHTHLPLSKEDPPLLSPPAHSKEDTPSHSKEDTPPPFKDVNKKRSTPKPIPAANYSPSSNEIILFMFMYLHCIFLFVLN